MIMKKYDLEDHRALAIWSLDCAERVLCYFEEAASSDRRPREAIEVGREWVRTGLFSMQVIRRASLDAHAAAKTVAPKSPACEAAHAAGQAVATPHVPQHAYGGAYYALKAIVALPSSDKMSAVLAERTWQERQLPEHLRDEVMSRLPVHDRPSGPFVTVIKGPDF